MNKVILIGNLTKDPELTFTSGEGKAVVKFGLAVARPFKKDETDFLNCVAWGKTGEVISEHFLKGNKIAVEGSIRTGSYDAKDGTKRYTTDINVEKFEFVESKKGQANSSNNDFGTKIDDAGTPFEDGDSEF